MINFYHKMRSLGVAAALTVAACSYAQQGTLGIAVTDITDTDARVQITPSSSDLTYYWGMMTEYKFNQAGGTEGIVDDRIKMWESTAKTYDMDWKEVMSWDLKNAPVDDNLSSRFLIYPDNDYVIYAFGMDEAGAVTTPVATATYSSVKATPSDNTFAVKIEAVTIDDSQRATVKVKVTPSNSDRYAVRLYEKKYVDKYDLESGKDARKELINDRMLSAGDSEIFTGEQTIEFTNRTANADCYIFVVGLDDKKAPSTDLTWLSFRTEEVQEQTASLAIDVKDATDLDATVVITPSSDDVKYFWGMKTKYAFEKEGGAEKAVENRIKVWEQLASYYDNTTWQEMMRMDLKSGTVSENLSERFSIYPAEEYVIYAFGMNDEGEVTAPVITTDWSSVPAQTSDNTFDFSIESVVIDDTERATVKAKVTPSNTDKYTVCLVEDIYLKRYDMETAGGQREFINDFLLYNLTDNNTYSGEQTIQFTGRTANADFTLFAIGVDSNNAPSTALAKLEFKTAPYTPEPEQSIKLEVTDITPMNAHYKITPSDEEMLYYIDIVPTALMEERGGKDIIAEQFIIDWWKFIADLYEDTKWQDLIPLQCRKGSLDTTVKELVEEGQLSNQYWGQDWTLYAVGFDLEGNIITPTETFSYTSPSPGTSSITFDMQVRSVELDETSTSVFEPYTINVDIYPSVTGEEFKAGYGTKSVWDSWANNPESGIAEYIKTQWMPNAVSFYDAVTLRIPGLNRYYDFDKSVPMYYKIIAMGWNEGPTTEPFVYDFCYDEAAGVTLTKSSDVTVIGSEQKITVVGECENVVVYNTSGQVAGVLRGAGSLEVPAGIYVVRYNKEGSSYSVKVAVR